MSVKQVRELLNARAESEASCEAALALVNDKLAYIRSQRRELAKLEASLHVMAQKCLAGCHAVPDACCSIFDDIAGSEL